MKKCGTRSMYNLGCPCEKCHKAHLLYMAAWRLKRRDGKPARSGNRWNHPPRLKWVPSPIDSTVLMKDMVWPYISVEESKRLLKYGPTFLS